MEEGEANGSVVGAGEVEVVAANGGAEVKPAHRILRVMRG